MGSTEDFMDSVKLALVRTNLREWQHCLYREGEAPAEPKQARQEPRSPIGTLVTFLTRSNSFTLVSVNGRNSARRDSPSITRDVSEGPARPSLTLRVGIFHSAARLCSPITQITEKREKRNAGKIGFPNYFVDKSSNSTFRNSMG